MRHIKLSMEDELPLLAKENYRRLRTNLEFSGMENKVICITSCAEQEGKSTVSYYLARVIAENSRSVLLVDADMRASGFADKYGYDRELPGLSHYLSGQEASADIIYKTDIAKLSFVPAGVFPPNPTELLNKQRFKTFVQMVKNEFDYVIIDTPPLGAVVDAAIIARESDASLMVMSCDRISRRAAVNIKNQLISANTNFLGVVLNKADYTGNRYGKGYEYGYGYGYGKQSKRRDGD